MKEERTGIHGDARRSGRSTVLPIIAAAFLLVALVSVGSAALLYSSGASDYQQTGPVPEPPPWDGRSTFHCGADHDAELRDMSVKLSGMAIDAGLNCRLTLVNMTVEADKPLQLGIGAQVVLRNSTLTGTGTGVDVATNGKLELVDSTVTGHRGVSLDTNGELKLSGSTIRGTLSAVDAGMSTRVEARKQSKLLSSGTALLLPMSGTARLYDSRLEGGKVAIAGGDHTRVVAVDTHLSGKETGIRVGVDGNVELKSSTLRSEGIAFRCTGRASFEAVNSTVSGQVAFDSGNNLASILLRGTKVSGKRQGQARIDEIDDKQISP